MVYLYIADIFLIQNSAFFYNNKSVELFWFKKSKLCKIYVHNAQICTRHHLHVYCIVYVLVHICGKHWTVRCRVYICTGTYLQEHCTVQCIYMRTYSTSTIQYTCTGTYLRVTLYCTGIYMYIQYIYYTIYMYWHIFEGNTVLYSVYICTYSTYTIQYMYWHIFAGNSVLCSVYICSLEMSTFWFFLDFSFRYDSVHQKY